MFNGAWLDRVWRLFMAECWLRDQADPEYSKKLLQTGNSPARERVTSYLFAPCSRGGADLDSDAQNIDHDGRQRIDGRR